ncbi:helix-turn-helix transcriptional regulator [Taklimakanibacter lacteus]|uniref:helix-turn-helix transcriptional regulator n=1 Tax=Taklimakanibacter lacteus TaxID=2268456 RepID=UPI000E65EEF3
MTVREADYLRILELAGVAILEPKKWIDVLRPLAQATGCIGGGLTLEDPIAGTGRPIDYFGFDDGHVEKTWHHYLPQNPLFRIAPKLQTGFFVTNGMVVREESFKRSEFYDGWARPQEICCPVTVVLHRSHSAYIPLTLVRADGHGDVDEEGLDFLGKLAPALTNAFAITMRLQRLEDREETFQAAMSRLSFGIVLLDEKNRIVFANGIGEDLIRDAGAFAAEHGQLRVNHGAAAAFEAAIATAPANFAITLRDGRSLFCVVLPLQRENGVFPDWESPTRMLVIGPQESDAALAGDALGAAFGLTPAERAVLEVLLRGEEPSTVASILGISVVTVRTHLLRIFAKTGMHRQSELMRLAWSMTPPYRR